MEEKKRRRKRRSKRVLERLNPAYEAFAGYPVLAALAIRPLSTPEISRYLVLSRTAVRNRLKTLELAGHVVQRFIDKKWVLRARLVAETPQPGEAYNALQTHQEAITDHQRPKTTVPLELPDSEAPEGAQKVATLFKVPVQVRKLGWARFGVEVKCVACPNMTRLRYGPTAVCVECANSWRNDVQD